MNAGYQINVIHDDSSVTNANFGLATNFRGVDKTVSPTDPRYTQQNAVLARWEMDTNHNAPFFDKWDLYLRANVVYSSQMLPDTEKFSLGGPSSVRGYQPSELRGDTGYLGTMELRRPFSVASFYGIFRVTSDTGEVTYKAPGFRDSSDRLHSVGVGAVFYPYKGLVASIDAARPIGGKPEAVAERSNRIWMSISASF
jgi:hemolysin activation/secretion protein